MSVVKLDANFIANSLICPPNKLKIEYCCGEVKSLFIAVTAASPGVGTFYFRTKNSAGTTYTIKIGHIYRYIAIRRKEACTGITK